MTCKHSCNRSFRAHRTAPATGRECVPGRACTRPERRTGRGGCATVAKAQLPGRAARKVLAALALLLATASVAPVLAQSQTLRCEGRLARVGDWDFQLRQTCGTPYFVEQWRALVSVATGPQVAISTPVDFEDWYFDQGSNRFLQRVRLRDGRITAVESLSAYGRRQPLEQCSGASVRTGISIGELVSLCGLPAQRRALDEALVSGHSPAVSVLPVRHQRWIYALSNSRWLIVELVHGRVAALDTTPAR